MKRIPKSAGVSRRQFVKQAAFGAGVLIVPGRALGLDGATPPSERLNLAGIGFGGQGGSDLAQFDQEHNIIGLCDVDARHAAHIFKKYPAAKRYTDFRIMLDEMKEIDGVVIATPDHLHAFASMAAIQHGKHVYCEKPLTHSVWEARRVAQAAREKHVATQMGNQGQASEETRRLCENIWAGAIGAVRQAHIWTDRPSNGLFNVYWPEGIDRPKGTPPVPETLDWDLWLGPAPLRPYNPAYLPFVWRGWWDFGTGALGDMACHMMDPVFRALKLAAPLSVQASSSRVNKETYPVASMVHYEFAARAEMPPVTLTWYDGGLRPPRPPEIPDGAEMGANGHMLVGDKGIILGNRIFPLSRRQEFTPPPRTLPRSPGHYKEWALACKGGKPAGSNFNWAGPLTEAVLLGNVALRVQLREELTFKKLLWDPVSFRFPNCPDADEFLRNEYRTGWTL